MAGTNEQVADVMAYWVDSGQADGFNPIPSLPALLLDSFKVEIVPLFQRRGRLRTEYRGATLREHSRLEHPAA